MKYAAILVLIVSIAEIAYAQAQFSMGSRADALNGPELLFGVWGTGSQCAAYRKGDQSNPALLPYEISNDWIRQGFIYCYLSWLGHESVDGSATAYANAQCGEDNIRDYRLRMHLQQNGLRIRWSEDFTTRELQVCAQAGQTE